MVKGIIPGNLGSMVKGIRYLFVLLGAGFISMSFYQTNSRRTFMTHQEYHEQCEAQCVDEQLYENIPEDFLIYTPTCTIPNIPINHPSIVKFKRQEPLEITCSPKTPLTEDEDKLLKFKLDMIWQYGLQTWEQLNCSYQGIVRINQDPQHYNGQADRGQKLKESVPITSPITPILDENAIVVTCYSQNSTDNNVVYRNLHYFIQPSVYEEKMKRYQRQLEEEIPSREERLNVLIIGKDSMSRNNLLRHMPNTYEYITKTLGGIDFQGYNKIGGNTFPNVFSMMTGIPAHEMGNGSCSSVKSQKLDDCPFTWKLYNQSNYVTFYLEDAPWMGTFRYTRTGFVEQPTDIYNSPYAFMSDGLIGHSANFRGQNGKICQGGKLTSEVLLDYNFKICKALHNKVPYFGLVWDGALTHDSLGMASASDQCTVKALKDLKMEGFLDNTFLIFMSDHGIRYGSIRSTYAGMLEERLPFLILVPPPGFKDKHSQAYANLQVNSRRLTSNLDVYGTVVDLGSYGYLNPENSFVGEKYGQSLFKVVPLNRTCEDLAISPHFCTCQNSTEADSNDPHLWNAANHTISKLNEGLAKFTDCVQLTLDKVLSGRVSTANDKTKPSIAESEITKYMIIFSAKPSGAVLESSVLYDTGNYKVLSDVSRINAYGNQSHCITDFTYRKYCYCKDLL
ncbi:uncharacterized protein LOC135220263 [Macrobrachium nipponense]|uniref:uncharacterized protein LOC135220263 n=1 Tax=Macrobrachium nipponense TaxID=159736 RepID=UPI0030C89F9A